MIDAKLKCVFVHCQKCAGESIEEAIFGRADNNYGGDPFEGSPEKHFSARQYISKYGPNVWQEYFTFAIVRNPWDRVISWIKYRDKRYGRVDPITPEKIKREVQSSIFVKNSYTNLLCDQNRRVLVDFVGRFENLPDDFNYIVQKVGLGSLTFPHLNRTAHEDFRKYYDYDSMQLVGQIFRDDIKLLGYSFHNDPCRQCPKRFDAFGLCDRCPSAGVDRQ